MRFPFLILVFVILVLGCNDDDDLTFMPNFIGTLGANEFQFDNGTTSLSLGVTDTTQVFTFGGRFGTDDGLRISIGFIRSPKIEDYEDLVGSDLITHDTFPQFYRVDLILDGFITPMLDGADDTNFLIIDRVRKTTRFRQTSLPNIEPGNIIEAQGRLKIEYEIEGELNVLEGEFNAEGFEML